MFALRWVTAGGVAVAISVALFFGMNWVILSADALNIEDNTRKIIDFVQVRTEQQLLTNERVKPQRPPEPQSAPIPEVTPEFDVADFQGGGTALSLGSVDIGNAIDISTGISLGPMEEDAEMVPLVRAPPTYPPAAARRGIEGFVTMQFTVTENGRVKDIVVTDANPPNVFERAAMDAARRYRYQPRLVDGEAVEVPGVTLTLNFKLER